MTVHHDKSVYGKLNSVNEEFSEEKLIKIAQSVNEEEDTSKRCSKEKGCRSPKADEKK